MKEIVEMMARAIGESRARDDEGEFPPLFDLLDFSGENKARTVLREAAQAALTAIEQAGFVVVPKEPTEAMGRVSGMEHRCSCGVRITQFAVNRWPAMIEAATRDESHD